MLTFIKRNQSRNRNNNDFMTAYHIRLLLVLMGLSLVWIMFAKLIVAPVIESAYPGESLSFLNRIIHGQGVHSVHHYLQVLDRVAIGGFVSSFGFLISRSGVSCPAFSP